MTQLADEIVGREGELRAFDAALDELARQNPVALELEGEPGIGKTRLLAELGRIAERRGYLFLTGSASELEVELPFWVFVDALADHLPETLSDELALVFPRPGEPLRGTLPDERHRAHHAVRELLAQLAARRPIVLALDDLHWADSGSLELLGALLRRPPNGPVLIALAMRPRQVPERLLPVLERAHRSGTLTRLELPALSRYEAHQLLGDAADTVYDDSGGNPFYLQQLARSLGRTGRLPRDVQAALAEELALLSDSARRVLEGAAVAGDPFAPELAAAAADTDEVEALDALDELLKLDLVRTTDVPRRFRFRHPLVRRAVYDAAPGGWRLAAHERAATALAAAGASATARAHHVERYAKLGDMDAVDVLRDAGLATDQALPASAAHWFAAALRLLPEGADQDRLGLLIAYARALAQSGDFAGSREALLEAANIKGQTLYVRARIVSACAAAERLLGRHTEARLRVERALDELPDRAVPGGVLLMMELSVDAFLQTDYPAMWELGRKALAVSQTFEDPPTLAASTAFAALADAFVGMVDDAQRHCDEAAALVDALPDELLVQRLDAGLHLMGAELHLDRFEDARRHGQRTLDLGRATGQGVLFPILLPALGACYEQLGRLKESAELLDGGIEAARLSGNRQALSLALMNRSATANTAGDIDTALACGEESLAIGAMLGNQLPSAFAGFSLVRALLLAGEPHRALDLLLRSGGGEDLPRMPGAWRAGGYELMTACRLGAGDLEGAARAVDACERVANDMRLRYAVAQADRAAAAYALHAGNPDEAARRALESAAAMDALKAPVQGALARTLAGRAFAAAGDRGSAIAQFERAAQAFEACDAPRRRDMVEQELRKLGRTVYRRSGASGLEALTARELEIARLVVDRQTNTQIAATLFLSKKTVETHLRNIFAKVGVSSRVELARVVERADRGG
ncbi:MAG TPA: AAA family ATPase [Solirubrobacter sp.]|nr:AAA family ATPase [Solirubrobacter sp.]